MNNGQLRNYEYPLDRLERFWVESASWQRDIASMVAAAGIVAGIGWTMGFYVASITAAHCAKAALLGGALGYAGSLADRLMPLNITRSR